MGKIISVVNQKGGVGKTTTAVNLGAYLAYLGKHVLLVDIDPQANATSGIGVDHRNLEHGIYFALEGLGQLLNTISLVQNNLKPELSIMGAVITMFDTRNKLSNSVMNELYQYFPNRVFRSIVPRSVRLAEAPSYGRSILHYDSKSRGAKAYERLAREIIDLEKSKSK